MDGYDYIHSIVFSLDNSKVIIADNGNNVKVWNVLTGTKLFRLDGLFGSNMSVQFSPDESKILTCSNKTINIWNAYTGKLLQTVENYTVGYKLLSSKFNHDGTKVVTSSSDNTIKIWDVENKRCICYQVALSQLTFK